MPRGTPLPDLTNQRFGSLIAIRKADIPSSSGKAWICQCDCGNTSTVTASRLISGKIRSCGCAEKVWVRKNFEGKVFGELLVLEDIGSDKVNRLYKCQCSCGNIIEKNTYQLTHTKTNKAKDHCGCLDEIRELQRRDKIRKHGMAGSREYSTWANMLQRTTNENHPDFEDYGGRGITVCDSWNSGQGGSFQNFYKDMGERPKGMTLERLNNNEGYFPENCVWANETTQNYHQRARKDNTSGVPGVHYDVSKDLWVCHIHKDNKQVHRSTHKSFEEAVRLRKELELEVYGYEKSR